MALRKVRTDLLWQAPAVRVQDPNGHIVELGEPMPSAISRLLNEGMSTQAVAERTAMPLQMVQQIADEA